VSVPTRLTPSNRAASCAITGRAKQPIIAAVAAAVNPRIMNFSPNPDVQAGHSIPSRRLMPRARLGHF